LQAISLYDTQKIYKNELSRGHRFGLKNMKIKRKKGYFSISAVAKMFSVHQQTIRLYEKEGLLCPRRSEGNTRLFSEEDVDRLEEIIYLTHQLGINLAGVEMIFKLKKQMQRMQTDMNKVFEQTQKQLEIESEQSKELMRTSARQLMKLKKQAHEKEPTEQASFGTDNWDIEYEED